MSTGRRRARSDSVSTALDAFRKVGQSHGWPATVTPLPGPDDAARATAIFAGITSARHVEDWRANDLTLAAQLANVTAQADRITQEIEVEGWTIPSPKNPLHMTRNPKLDALTLISSRQLSLTRALGLSGTPTDRRQIENNRKRLDAARAVSDDAAQDSGLLA